MKIGGLGNSSKRERERERDREREREREQTGLLRGGPSVLRPKGELPAAKDYRT
jgi:hypothetical protein